MEAADHREVLIFRLTGPMAAFGAPAVGEQRPVWPAPSKSGVLGLVGAALGLRREEAAAHAALHEGLGFAVRVDSPGAVLRDFHTAQAPVGADFSTRREELCAPGQGFVLSDRRYAVDVAYTPAVWRRGACPWSLQEIAEALSRPRFALYLGRRSCPLGRPPRPHLLKAPTLLDALAAYDAVEPGPPCRHPDVWSDAPGDGFVGELRDQRRRRDGLFNRAEWLFRDRVEGRVTPTDSDPAP